MTWISISCSGISGWKWNSFKTLRLMDFTANWNEPFQMRICYDGQFATFTIETYGDGRYAGRSSIRLNTLTALRLKWVIVNTFQILRVWKKLLLNDSSSFEEIPCDNQSSRFLNSHSNCIFHNSALKFEENCNKMQNICSSNWVHS